MKLKVCLGACALLVSSLVLAQQEQPKMSAEEKAQMEAMMKAGTPGENHKKLASMVGTWDTTVKMYPMQPGAPVQQSTGTSVNEWVLGGRWVRETFSGKSDESTTPLTNRRYIGNTSSQRSMISTRCT